ncbi:MAG: phosphoribosyltransferase [Candidatus Daviesbacteria bacterium]|nr:phosphoribosyltransferase [Candidatus Daviesbacteria bacterium]
MYRLEWGGDKVMSEYEQKVKEKFPNLKYDEFLTIDNSQQRLAIDDLSYKYPKLRSQFQDAIELFVLACKGFTNVYSVEDLAFNLSKNINCFLRGLNPDETILVFPGEGAKQVQSQIPTSISEIFKNINIEVRRQLAPNMAVMGVNIMTPSSVIKKLLPSKITTCILLDDVITTGATAFAIKDTVDERSKFDWQAASWMMLSPLQVKNRKDDDLRSGLSGYSRTITGLIYQGESGIPANNSLSTFAGSGPKSESVITRYREKYVENQLVFTEAIMQLRRLINE